LSSQNLIFFYFFSIFQKTLFAFYGFTGEITLL